jgi:hypothetical protein
MKIEIETDDYDIGEDGWGWWARTPHTVGSNRLVHDIARKRAAALPITVGVEVQCKTWKPEASSSLVVDAISTDRSVAYLIFPNGDFWGWVALSELRRA